MDKQILYSARPSGKLLALWFLWTAGTWCVIGLFMTLPLLSILFTAENPTPAFIVLVTFVVLLIVFHMTLLVLTFNTYKYGITDEGVTFEGGFLLRKKKFVPFAKITNLEESQGIFEQILGIKRLGFQTAGTGGVPIPEIVFAGIQDTEKLQELVRKRLKSSKAR